jgi:predicted enzyme related to lactoylglutathione lyase
MSLWSSKIVYIFIDTSDLSAQRVFFEDVIGLEVIESDFHPPHHRHGVVKYNAQNTILALNIADSGFHWEGSDCVVTQLTATAAREAEIYADLQIHGHLAPPQPGAVFSDRDNHQFAVRRPPSANGLDNPGQVAINGLHLQVNDLSMSHHFYSDLLGLELLNKTGDSLVFSAGDLRLSLHLKPCGRAEPRRGFLIVFSTPDIQETHHELQDRGVEFKAPVRFSEIGGTVRFVDPTGHVYCLYQPSQECLEWDSGPTLIGIISGEKAQTGKEILQ